MMKPFTKGKLRFGMMCLTRYCMAVLNLRISLILHSLHTHTLDMAFHFHVKVKVKAKKWCRCLRRTGFIITMKQHCVEQTKLPIYCNRVEFSGCCCYCAYERLLCGTPIHYVGSIERKVGRKQRAPQSIQDGNKALE